MGEKQRNDECLPAFMASPRRSTEAVHLVRGSRDRKDIMRIRDIAVLVALACACSTALAYDASERRFIREGMSEGEVVAYNGDDPSDPKCHGRPWIDMSRACVAAAEVSSRLNSTGSSPWRSAQAQGDCIDGSAPPLEGATLCR